jgi:hypothetical protein
MKRKRRPCQALFRRPCLARAACRGRARGGIHIAELERIAVFGLGRCVGPFRRQRRARRGKVCLRGQFRQCFRGAERGLLVVSGVETELFDGDGALLARAAGSRVSPLISAGKRNAAIWSLGGDEICLIDHKGRERYIDAGSGLVSVAVNNGGWTASVSGEEGYKGSVTVYDDGGVSVYKVFLGSGYPVDADVSPSCDSLAVLSLTEGGSRLSVYGLDDEEEKHSWVAARFILTSNT